MPDSFAVCYRLESLGDFVQPEHGDHDELGEADNGVTAISHKPRTAEASEHWPHQQRRNGNDRSEPAASDQGDDADCRAGEHDDVENDGECAKCPRSVGVHETNCTWDEAAKDAREPFGVGVACRWYGEAQPVVFDIPCKEAEVGNDCTDRDWNPVGADFTACPKRGDDEYWNEGSECHRVQEEGEPSCEAQGVAPPSVGASSLD